MTPKEIGIKLSGLNIAHIEKLGGQPWSSPNIVVNDGGTCVIYLRDKSVHDKGKSIRATTFEKAIELAFAHVASMPDPDGAAKHKWHKKLADVIDEGHALSLPDEVMEPLRTGSQAMTENLLTDQRATA